MLFVKAFLVKTKKEKPQPNEHIYNNYGVVMQDTFSDNCI